MLKAFLSWGNLIKKDRKICHVGSDAIKYFRILKLHTGLESLKEQQALPVKYPMASQLCYELIQLLVENDLYFLNGRIIVHRKDFFYVNGQGILLELQGCI